MIHKFVPINLNYKKLLENITQRKALERLIVELGLEEVTKLVETLPKVVHEKYCPVITTPVELEKNLPHLFVFLKKRENQSSRKVTKI